MGRVALLMHVACTSLSCASMTRKLRLGCQVANFVTCAVNRHRGDVLRSWLCNYFRQVMCNSSLEIFLSPYRTPAPRNFSLKVSSERPISLV